MQYNVTIGRHLECGGLTPLSPGPRLDSARMPREGGRHPLGEAGLAGMTRSVKPERKQSAVKPAHSKLCTVV